MREPDDLFCSSATGENNPKMDKRERQAAFGDTGGRAASSVSPSEEADDDDEEEDRRDAGKAGGEGSGSDVLGAAGRAALTGVEAGEAGARGMWIRGEFWTCAEERRDCLRRMPGNADSWSSTYRLTPGNAGAWIGVSISFRATTGALAPRLILDLPPKKLNRFFFFFVSDDIQK